MSGGRHAPIQVVGHGRVPVGGSRGLGRRSADVSDRQGDPDIFRVHPDGTELVQVTRASAAEKYPAWSPDSSFLVVASDRTGNFQLYRMNLTGGDWRRLTMDTYSNLSPAWVRK